MRLLFLPWTGAKFLGDSNYLMHRRLARALADLGCSAYVGIPKGLPNRPEDEERVKYVEVLEPDGMDFSITELCVDFAGLVKKFGWKYGDTTIDGVVTSRRTIGPYLSQVLACRDIFGGRKAGMPVVLLDVFPESFANQDDVNWRMTAFGSSEIYTVFLTEGDRRERITNTAKLISASVARRLEERSTVLNIGMNCASVKEIRESEKKFEKFTLFYGGRINVVKRIDRIFGAFMKVFELGNDVQIVATTSTGISLGAGESLGDDWLRKIELYTDVTWEQYARLAARSHAFLVWSKNEGLPTGFWEQMYMGVVGVFPRLPWVTKQIPPDYPFIFETENEAIAKLLWIRDHYEEAQSHVKKLWPMIEEQFDMKLNMGRLRDYLEKNKGGYNVGATSRELIDDIVGGRDHFSFDYVKTELCRKGRVFEMEPTPMSGWKYPSWYDVYRCVLDMGFVDDHKQEVPYFVRPEKGA